MSDIPRCAICNAYATATLTEGHRCEDCLHRTLSIHRTVLGLAGSAKVQVAHEAAKYIDHVMSTTVLNADQAALLLRLRAALGGV